MDVIFEFFTRLIFHTYFTQIPIMTITTSITTLHQVSC